MNNRFLYIFSLRMILVLLLMSFSSWTLQARLLSLGATGGMNVTKVDGSKAYNLDSWSPSTEQGWYTGAKLKLVGELTGFGADASLLYSQEALSVSRDNHDVARYIAVPVHFRWEMGVPILEHAFVPFAFIGPQFSWLMNDLDFDLDKTVSENIDIFKTTKKAASWKLDLGAGILLFQHTELFYTYVFPFKKTFSIRNLTAEEMHGEQEEFVKNYRNGVHRIGLTIYF